MKLQRKLSQWAGCEPEAMAKMSPAAIQYALADAKADIIAMATALRESDAAIKELAAALARVAANQNTEKLP